ncbi:MAG: hypothetical protein ABJA32_08550 [Ginsengibacter sp.]
MLKCIKFLCLFFFFAWYSCKSDDQNEVEKCKQIIKQDKNIRLANYDSVYQQIVLQKKSSDPKSMLADSLHKNTKEAIVLIDSLVAVVEKMDSTGYRKDVGQTVLITSLAGDRLGDYVNSIYRQCAIGFNGRKQLERLQKDFSKYTKYPNTEEVLNGYFSPASSAFVTATLLNIRMNIARGAAQSLYYIDTDLRNSN